MANDKATPAPIEKTGSFNLSRDTNLISYVTSGEGLKVLNIRQSVASISIYESFKTKFLSGNIRLVDNQGVIEMFPLTGHELLEFKLTTPGAEEMPYDFSRATGFPMHVYKVSDIKQINVTTKTYVLHFCSRELIRNYTEVIDTAKSGTIDNMVMDILRNNLYTKKDIYTEPTIGNRKYVFPRMNPAEAITMIGGEAQSKKFVNTGYRFYETRYGFNFRSLESMYSNSNKTAREPKASYYDAPKTKAKDYASNYQKVDAWETKGRFDTLKSLKNGVWSSKMIYLNGLTKEFGEYNYSYEDDFDKLTHVGTPTIANKTAAAPILPRYNYKDSKTLSAFPDANTYFQFSSTSAFTEKEEIDVLQLDGTITKEANPYKVRDQYDRAPVEDMLQRQKGQQYALEQGSIQLKVPGNSTLCLGDVIKFSTVLEVLAKNGSKSYEDDPYLTGNYLITQIAHNIDVAEGQMTTNMVIMKDCISNPYAEENQRYSEGKRPAQDLNVYTANTKKIKKAKGRVVT